MISGQLPFVWAGAGAGAAANAATMRTIDMSEVREVRMESSLFPGTLASLGAEVKAGRLRSFAGRLTSSGDFSIVRSVHEHLRRRHPQEVADEITFDRGSLRVASRYGRPGPGRRDPGGIDERRGHGHEPQGRSHLGPGAQPGRPPRRYRGGQGGEGRSGRRESGPDIRFRDLAARRPGGPDIVGDPVHRQLQGSGRRRRERQFHSREPQPGEAVRRRPGRRGPRRPDGGEEGRRRQRRVPYGRGHPVDRPGLRRPEPHAGSGQPDHAHGQVPQRTGPGRPGAEPGPGLARGHGRGDDRRRGSGRDPRPPVGRPARPHRRQGRVRPGGQGHPLRRFLGYGRGRAAAALEGAGRNGGTARRQRHPAADHDRAESDPDAQCDRPAGQLHHGDRCRLQGARRPRLVEVP
ncbi:MAG: hypothetical protein MZU91_10865 [Desulfosudis oleivorans]|nr:hypothetical protein [Desulfosudis oleivorans]